MINLTLIQSQLKVPKSNVNAFGKYKYRSAEDILEAVKPLLLKHECILDLSDKIKPIGDKLFLIATATFFDGESTKKVNGYAELGEHKGMSSEQCTGTASSYARKYALNGLFLIDETQQDPDYSQGKDKPSESTQQAATQNVSASKAKELPPIGEIKGMVLSISTVDALTKYFIELGSPKIPVVLDIFTTRKLELNGSPN